MKNPRLAKVLREKAEGILSRENRTAEDADAAECLCVLARVCEGKPIVKAFGAPGDWGYGTPIGDAHSTGWLEAQRQFTGGQER